MRIEHDTLYNAFCAASLFCIFLHIMITWSIYKVNTTDVLFTVQVELLASHIVQMLCVCARSEFLRAWSAHLKLQATQFYHYSPFLSLSLSPSLFLFIQMTRYTKLGRKTFVKSDDSFNVTPLLPRKQDSNTNKGSDQKNNQRNDRSRNKRKRDDNDDNNSNNKRKKEVCFACRQPGHSVKNCPKSKEHVKICYNCGSTEHGLKECKKPRKGSKLTIN